MRRAGAQNTEHQLAEKMGFCSFGRDPQLVTPESWLAGAWAPQPTCTWIFWAQNRVSFHGGPQQFLSRGSADSSGLVVALPSGLLEGQNFAACGAGTSQTPRVWKMFLSLSDVRTPFNLPICFSHHSVGWQSNDRSFSLAGGTEGEEVGSSGPGGPDRGTVPCFPQATYPCHAASPSLKVRGTLCSSSLSQGKGVLTHSYSRTRRHGLGRRADLGLWSPCSMPALRKGPV